MLIALWALLGPDELTPETHLAFNGDKKLCLRVTDLLLME
jgi:hypothetical protein